MSNSLVINSSPSEVRVALLENDVPCEVYIERQGDRGVVGNVYRGKVVRVLPGMQAAFVEIGLERTGFLYVNDALPMALTAEAEDDEPEERRDGDDEDPEVESPRERRPSRTQPAANIADILKQGQEILVQVQKEPLGTKGARLTRHVSIPGRHLVYMPFSQHIGVSRRITDPMERDRLKQAVTKHRDGGGGFIVRTATEGVEDAEIEREAKMLRQLWRDIEKRGASGPTPRVVYEDLDLVLRATRDLFVESIDRVIVDREEDFDRVKSFVSGFAPESESKVELYRTMEPIFDHYGIEVEIERALERRVWLKSGGYIVIDQAEALTVVDVNSGRFVGKSSLEETITQINLEAVKEVVFQIRLRNIGGIIIIDFIDMARVENREKVLAALQEALKRDKAKTTIVRMSEIGLVEMTRKRVRESLGHLLTETCSYCKGRGAVKSERTVANEILRAIARHLAREPAGTVLVNMQPSIADYLYATENVQIEELEKRYQARIVPVAREGYHRENWELVTTPKRTS